MIQLPLVPNTRDTVERVTRAVGDIGHALLGAEDAIRELSAALAAREKALLAREATVAAREAALASAGDTLAIARATFNKDAADGTTCPCCDRYAKVYRRKFHASMASALISFFGRVRGDVAAEVHVPRETKLSALGGDWAKIRHWKLIETRFEEREDGGPNSGLWRITELGVRFVMGHASIPAYVFLWNGEPVPSLQPVPTISIRQALGKDFDYPELMRTAGIAIDSPVAPVTPATGAPA